MNSNLINKLQYNLKSFQTKDIGEVLKHGKVYLAGEVATKALAFISIIVFTYLLSPSEYGIYQVFISYSSIFVIVLTLNFHQSVARYYYDEPPDFGQFLNISIIGSLFFLFLSLLFFFIFGINFVAELISLPKELIFLLIFQIIIGIVYSIFNQICISRKQSSTLVKFNIAKIYLAFFFSLIFIWILQTQKYLGPILGTLVIGLLFSGYIFKKMIFHEIRWGVSGNHIRYIFSYSVPLVPYSLSTIILGQIDRIMINNYVGATEAGLYSMAYNIAMLLGLVTAALQSALIPDWFRLMKKEQYQRIDIVVDRIFRITLFIALGLVLFAGDLMLILIDERYYPALFIIPIVVIGYVFEAMFKVYGRSIGFTNKMIYVAAVGIFAGIINVILNQIYIPLYGYAAGAYTTVISYFLMFLLSFWVAKYTLKQRVTPMMLLLKPLLVFGISVFTLYLILYFELTGITLFLLKVSIFFMFLIFLLKWKVPVLEDIKNV
jgi:O-antigen/teichoic acid export membrane protein